MQNLYTYDTTDSFTHLGNKDVIVSRTVDIDIFFDEADELEPSSQICEEFFVFYNINPHTLKDLKKLHGYMKKQLHDGLVNADQPIDQKLLNSLIKYSSSYEHIVFDLDNPSIIYKKTNLKDEQKAKLEGLIDKFKLDSAIVVNLIAMIFYGATNHDIEKAIESYLRNEYYNDLEPFEKMQYRLELGQDIADETRYVQEYYEMHGVSPYEDDTTDKKPF